ncbi:hypothetical protein CBR_g34629 [Chara braunii]|uniref:SP-RING-type domain-containing protein n=1 Tax=Chara braunii TaxID=69332 RepID=A0A388LJD7_CHABU|nr:hypothetical protein CBR_g34629 [Chara braunii]|eukprot:GBG82345.1 hypothetical protein CBR_g34629 [Chara braunii]
MHTHEARGSKGEGGPEEEALGGGIAAPPRVEIRVPYAEDLKEILDSVRKIADNEGVGKAMGSGKKKAIGCKHAQTCDAILYLLRELHGWLVSAKQKGLIRGIKAAEHEARRGGSTDGTAKHITGKWSGYDVISGVIGHVREVSGVFVKKHTEALLTACSECMVLLGLETPPLPKVSAGVPKWVRDKLGTEQGIAELVKVALNQKVYPAEWTVNKMKEKSMAATEDELDLESGRIRLQCPVSARRMKVASKSVHCAHLDCFDLQTHLMLNAHRTISAKTWKCPHCKQSASWNELIVDAYVQGILREAERAVEVQIFTDATWQPVEESRPEYCGEWEECSSSSSEEHGVHQDQGGEFSSVRTDMAEGRVLEEQTSEETVDPAGQEEEIPTHLIRRGMAGDLCDDRLTSTLERCSIVAAGQVIPEGVKDEPVAEEYSDSGCIGKDCRAKDLCAMQPLTIGEDADLVDISRRKDLESMDRVFLRNQMRSVLSSALPMKEVAKRLKELRETQIGAEVRETQIGAEEDEGPDLRTTAIDGESLRCAASSSGDDRLEEREPGEVEPCSTDCMNKKQMGGIMKCPDDQSTERLGRCSGDIKSDVCQDQGTELRICEGKGDGSAAGRGDPSCTSSPIVIDLTLDDDEDEDEEENVPVVDETQQDECWTSNESTHQSALPGCEGCLSTQDNDQDASGVACLTTEEREVGISAIWSSQREERQQLMCLQEDVQGKGEGCINVGVMDQENGVLAQDRLWVQDGLVAESMGMLSHKSSDSSMASKRKWCDAATSGHSADQDLDSCSKRGSTSGCPRSDSDADCVLVLKDTPAEAVVNHAIVSEGTECGRYSDSGGIGAVAFSVPITDPVEEVLSPPPRPPPPKKAALVVETEGGQSQHGFSPERMFHQLGPVEEVLSAPPSKRAALVVEAERGESQHGFSPEGTFCQRGSALIRCGDCSSPRAETGNGTVVQSVRVDLQSVRVDLRPVPSHIQTINADSTSVHCENAASNGPGGELPKGFSYNDLRESCTAVRSGNDMCSYSTESMGDAAGLIRSCRVRLQEDDGITNSGEDVDTKNGVLAEAPGLVSARARPLGCRSMLRMARGRGAVLVRAMESCLPVMDRDMRNHLDARRGVGDLEERSTSTGSNRGQLRRPEESSWPLEASGSFTQEASLQVRGQPPEVSLRRNVLLGEDASRLGGIPDQTTANVELLENLTSRLYTIKSTAEDRFWHTN